METQLVDAIGQVVCRDDTVVAVNQSVVSETGVYFTLYNIVLIRKQGVVLGTRGTLSTESLENFKRKYIKVERREV